MQLTKAHTHKAFTLVEILVATALFAMISVAVYQSYGSLTAVISVARIKVTAADLLNERLEIIRNMPYSQVGIVNGIPNGILNHSDTFVRDGITFQATTTIRNIDDPFDGTIGGTPNDLTGTDYKMVEVDITCATCKNFTPMDVTTLVAPKNLETASTNGALFVKVFDANGNPIENANVHVVDTKVTPNLVVDDVTNAQGILQIVDAPPGANAYHITVSKSGYTSDQTYATSSTMTHPVKPDATVVIQQVTQVSFSIDQISTMNISAVNTLCAPVPNLAFTLTGTKTINTTPTIYKYSQNLTLDGSGNLSLPNMEWDNYTPIITTSGKYLGGANPLLPVTVLPGASQNMQLVVTTGPATVLLVNVKDNPTSLPISGATVTLTKSGYNNTLTTGRGFITQTDWSGGSGQASIGDPTKYYSSDGNVSGSNPVGDLTLNKIFSNYAPSGSLTSSTFDTGTTSNFNQITWNPVSQPAQTGTPNLRFQIAANNDNATWLYTGPDGTNGSYYSTSNTNINATTSGNRYFRYMAFLDTASTTYTPDLSDVSLTFTSGCTPPGQVAFTGLSSGTYTLTVSNTGYATYTGTVAVSGNSVSQDVNLQPL